jgi:GTPase SAR1 family protein
LSDYFKSVLLEGTAVHIRLNFWDASLPEDQNKMKYSWYQETDVFLLCFDVGDPNSLTAIQEEHILDIRQICPGAPFFLVGLKSDLRGGEHDRVSKESALKVAEELGAVEYHECSALTQQGIQELFQRVAEFGYKKQLQPPQEKQ